MKRRSFGAVAYLAWVVGLSTSSLVKSQTSESPKPATPSTNDLSEIVVTARRIEERAQDVPISMTIFNEQQLTKLNIVNAQDLALYTPSLSANSSFGADNSTFAIRGFVQDNGTPPSVGIYFADVVAPRGAGNGFPAGNGAGPGSFFDLRNVQVLKGPQGTLFGRNTTGGAVLLVPQKPTSKLEGYVEASGGNYGMWRLQGILNLPLSDAVRFRIGVDHESRDGYIDNTSGIGPSRFGDLDFTALRASVVIDLTPNLENYAIASYSHSRNNGVIQKTVAANCDPITGGLLGPLACAQLADQAAKGQTGFYQVRSTIPNPYDRLTQWQLINTTTWHASDTLVLKNIVSYAELRQALNATLFGTQFFAPNGDPVSFASIGAIPGYDSTAQNTFTEEYQLQGSLANGRLTYQAGLYIELSDPLGQSGTQTPTLLNCSDPQRLVCTDPFGIEFTQVFGFPTHVGAVNYTRLETRFTDEGLYSQSTYSLTDHLKLTGGVRFTWDSQRVTSERFGYIFPVVPPFDTGPVVTCGYQNTVLPGCELRASESSRAPTWLIGLDYKPIDDVLIYGKYARGYRAGGVQPSAPAQFVAFQPEKVDSYETGVKTEFPDLLRSTVNLSAFYNNFRGQQLQAGFNTNIAVGSTAPPTAGVVNAGKSRIWGLEAELDFTPLQGLVLDAAYTYLNTKLLKVAPVTLSPTDPYVSNFTVNPGDPLPLAPKNEATLTATYTLPLTPDLGRVSVGATYSHSDRQISNYSDRTSPATAIQGLSYLPARNLLNLNLNWSSIGKSHVDVSLFATNVTNRNYVTFIPGLEGFETAVLGEPRMYGGRVRYSF